ncbi:putative SOS response-associated peptidase YedK [Litorivivens lipolytica]|uniref:Abasic site processing protein n=1 Tax=Litorivivens lipolytica TaxID=1524264 RepID=A0A7W4W4N6_9GAMM|nr:SOS response-associated peptidase [Litorivivens lipolytica]MBB3046812.1 putative SOS response-associated peptidase YedK [Litorivivens lipolytica]
MCGAFEQHHRSVVALTRLLKEWPSDAERRRNIRPTMMAGTVDAEGYRERSWSLIPRWAKEPKLKYSTFNARAESLSEKATFRDPWRRSQRCVVPASAYFEWPVLEGKKQAFRLRRADGEVWLMAGLWESWEQGDEKRETFTVITTTPAQQIEWVHNRMPLMIDPKDLNCWLTGSPEEAKQLLDKKPSVDIEAVPGHPTDPVDDD